jgi:KEOPS complex subunit Pcc1
LAIYELFFFFNIISKLVFNVKAKATVRLKFSPKQRQIILNSLKPEISNPASHRSRAKLYTKNGMVILQIEANDSTALRASLNSYLRWINSILNVLETLKAHQQLCE